MHFTCIECFTCIEYNYLYHDPNTYISHALFASSNFGIVSSGHAAISQEASLQLHDFTPLVTFRICRTFKKIDGVPRTQTSRLLLSYCSSRSHGTVCTTTCKGRNYCRPRDPASWQKMAAIPDGDSSAANSRQPGLSADNHSSIAALDTLSTVFEQPLGRS